MAFTVRDVFSFKEEKRQPKDVVAMQMGDEDGLDVGRRDSCSSQSQQGSRRRIDDVFSIENKERVVAFVGQECITSTEHSHFVGHGCRFQFISFKPMMFGCEILGGFSNKTWVFSGVSIAGASLALCGNFLTFNYFCAQEELNPTKRWWPNGGKQR